MKVEYADNQNVDTINSISKDSVDMRTADIFMYDRLPSRGGYGAFRKGRNAENIW